jgi:AcrR family transcriptional regulator
VKAAIHLFAEKGFRGATTRGLAAALGVSGPVLYQHFKNKRDTAPLLKSSRSPETNM